MNFYSFLFRNGPEMEREEINPPSLASTYRRANRCQSGCEKVTRGAKRGRKLLPKGGLGGYFTENLRVWEGKGGKTALFTSVVGAEDKYSEIAHSGPRLTHVGFFPPLGDSGVKIKSSSFANPQILTPGGKGGEAQHEGKRKWRLRKVKQSVPSLPKKSKAKTQNKAFYLKKNQIA